MTARMILILALSAISGCSLGLRDECDHAYTPSGTIVQCSDQADTSLWIRAVPRVLADLETVLPGVTDIAAGLEIRVEDVGPDATLGGEYLGYHGDNAVAIYIRPGDNVEPRYSALAHEWAHAWEHQVAGITYEEWYASETHFVNHEMIVEALGYATSIDREVLECRPL